VKNGGGLAIMSGFGFGARIDDFTARKQPGEKRFNTRIALSHPAVTGSDRLFEILDPAITAKPSVGRSNSPVRSLDAGFCLCVR
jgi:hypothetical protein